MKKKLSVFSLALNALLIVALSFSLIKYKNEENRREYLAEEKDRREIAECTSLLLKCEEAVRHGDFEKSRGYLLSAAYVGAANESFSRISGMADYCFFESDRKSKEDLLLIIPVLRSIITGERLGDAENEIIERLRSEYSFKSFEAASYPILSALGEVGEKQIEKKIGSILGRGASFRQCKNTLYPLRHIYVGGNTCMSVSSGGRLISFFFFLDSDGKVLDSDEVTEKMEIFLKNEKIPSPELKSLSLDSSYAYAVFSPKNDQSKKIKVIASLKSGRVCYFDAEGYYKE